MEWRIGSLFSGIGGLELGLEAAGVGRVVFQVEIDPFCREVLAMHWPDVDRSRCDVRTLRAGDLPWVEVICGGFPCQGVSRAGTRRGLDDERSGLWRDFARIVRDYFPLAVVVENSDELTRRGLDVVCADLADAGYKATPLQVRASDVGAPHSRPRTFVVAHRRHDGQQGLSSLDGARSSLDVQRRRELDRCGVVGDGEARAAQSGLVRGAHGISARLDAHRWPSLRGMTPAEGEPARQDDRRSIDRRVRIHALGNAVVPHVARVVGRKLIELVDQSSAVV